MSIDPRPQNSGVRPPIMLSPSHATPEPADTATPPPAAATPVPVPAPELPPEDGVRPNVPRGLWLTRLGRLWTTNWFMFIPLVAIVLFAGAMIFILYQLHATEVQQQRDALYRDAAWAEQKVRLSLQSNQDQVAALARDIGAAQLDPSAYRDAARQLLRENPELVFINWLDATRRPRWAFPANSEFAQRVRETRDHPLEAEIQSAYDTARETQRAVYSRPIQNERGESFMLMEVPIVRDNEFLGTVGAMYSVTGILTQLLPGELTDRYRFSLVDKNNVVRASTSLRPVPKAAASYEVLLDPPGHSLSLRAEAYPAPSNLPNNMLMWLVAGLSCFVIWSLWSVWRHTSRRSEAQRALLAETSFRRAMENSMVIGLRSLDLNGRITYVNPAFCRMIGWTEQELVGRMPPFPYWPPNEIGEMQKYIELTLRGKAPANGMELRMVRRDGTSFYARMYVSPLIDARGRHTGWMSSITDITEPKRAREDLAAAHDRFTTVLESLDAAVSVLSTDKAELLFANRYYRQLFGWEGSGHLQLSGNDVSTEDVSSDALDLVDGFAGLPASELTPHAADAREVYLPSMQKWFEVRRRYIQWVDGHLAQMQIATDITVRKAAEEMTRQHEERLQFTSRLTTMGEMASSLAHELNQPLAAINNYCMGAVGRLKSGRSTPEELIPVLEKTSAQAVRAGTIIQRIRGFVKRSQPQRRESDLREIVADAVGLAELEAIRRGVTILTRLPAGLPPLYVDPVLIEQVLVNLLKNAVEAMAAHPRLRAAGVLRLHACLIDDPENSVLIEVIDQGPGVDDSTKERLFEPFFSTKSDGMGMGLNICRSIIESHLGRLWVENNADGIGCTFKIILPLHPV
ncbi:PAS domain S-box protein [Ralstonia solanacearum]|uniref:PAS domain S-box protein n=1 Tax=Ralstonia solanacearum TaxID=305 RepID=UPI00202A66DB|nr:PAS domain S-box protein [Ralstonia solanacearum]MCL9845194.1 PAS domain S-box protein [Ralstonia solanacearum]MDC6255752.1 PAS domain S-box protein [Ralstonia solanacearum]MDC6260139.1 PAS domain S-box protein [Ralstonia solanacearum]MDC6305071.1 PAS domain S-box protein [Ralstonia solanacearum]